MSERAPPDFRKRMIARALHDVRTIVLVLSGKGGVGKSVISATLSAVLAESGSVVGLLDADVYGPSSALLMGARARPRETEEGLVPTSVRKVKVMSVDQFAPGRTMPLTGRGAAEVLKEMLALTHWGYLDFLVIDMPPATGDITMLLTALRKGGLEGLVVTAPDRLSLSVARRTARLLRTERVPIVGIVSNMNPQGGAVRAQGPAELAEEFEVPLVGSLPYDRGVTSAVESGDLGRLLRTKFAHDLREVARRLAEGAPGGAPRTPGRSGGRA